VSNRQQRRAQKSPKSRTTVADPATILWFSNAPWSGTGYSTQTAQAVTRMRRDGHNVAISNNYGLQGMRTVWEDIPIYPMGFEAYSNDVVAANFKDWTTQNPGSRSHIIALFDAWPLKGAWVEEMPVSIWCMVDHMPVPPNVLKVIERPNVTPIAVSLFGQDQMHRAGIEYAPYIPMAIDTKDTYKPTATYNGKTGRELMGFDGDPESYFVCSLINANKGMPGRKAWGENLLAFSIFAARHDDARLYIHSERHGNYGGQNLDAIIAAAKANGASTDPLIRQRIAKAEIGLRLMRYGALRMLSNTDHASVDGAALTYKIQWASWRRSLGELAMDVLGQAGEVTDHDGYEWPMLPNLFLYSRADTIYGGTNQIQRNLIAERGLGLPREPRGDA
jgi:hypothetical protein